MHERSEAGNDYDDERSGSAAPNYEENEAGVD